MKQPRSYFVFNKTADYERSWLDNMICRGDRLQVADPERPGVFWSRLLDSREKENLWHRLTMETRGLVASSVRLALYCSEGREVLWDGEKRDLGQLLRDRELTDQDRLKLSEPWLRRTAQDPRDLLLHDVSGRYLWFRLELIPRGGEAPEAGPFRIRFPRESWTQYLPEIYQEGGPNSFTDRFLEIFAALYRDLDEDIRDVTQNLDPDVVSGPYLEWLSGWLDIEDGYLWPEEKLRELIKRGMELYRIRGTREYLIEMVKLYTGHTPWVVEYSQIEPFFTDTEQAALLKRLYGDNPYAVTLLLEGRALESTEAGRALFRIIDNARPAWVEVEPVVLTPYLFLDQYSYLGINSRLDRYRPPELDGRAALPFVSLGGEDSHL